MSIKQSAQEVGLNLSIQSLTPAQLFSGTQNNGKVNDFGLALYLVVADLINPYGILGFNYTTKGPTNGMAYSDKKVDENLAAALELSDDTSRARLEAAAEKMIFDATPATVLYSPDQFLFHNSRIGGYQMRPMWSWDSFMADLSGN